MKRLVFFMAIAGVIFIGLSGPILAAPNSKFKQYIIPLECTVDIVDNGSGDPYASIQPEDCDDPDDPPIPLPPGVPPFDEALAPYYPRSLTINNFQSDLPVPVAITGFSLIFDFDNIKALLLFIISLIFILLLLLLLVLLIDYIFFKSRLWYWLIGERKKDKN